MKKLIFVLTAFVLLTGCTRTFEPQPVYPEVPVTTIHPSETAIGEPEPADPFAMQEIGVVLTAYDASVCDIDNTEEDKNRLFSDYDELSEFIENVIAPNYPNGVPEKFYDYDEKFFEENVLFYTAASYPSSSVQILTEDTTAFMQYGAVTISVPVITPEIGCDAMAYICFFAELDKNRVGDISEKMIMFNTVNSDCEIIAEVMWYHAPDGVTNDYRSHHIVYKENGEAFLSIRYSAVNDTYYENRKFLLDEQKLAVIDENLNFLAVDWQPDGTVLAEGNEGDYFFLSGVTKNRHFSFACNDEAVPVALNNFVNMLETIALDCEVVQYSVGDGDIRGDGMKNYPTEETTSVPEQEAE